MNKSTQLWLFSLAIIASSATIFASYPSYHHSGYYHSEGPAYNYSTASLKDRFTQEEEDACSKQNIFDAWATAPKFTQAQQQTLNSADMRFYNSINNPAEFSKHYSGDVEQIKRLLDFARLEQNIHKIHLLEVSYHHNQKTAEYMQKCANASRLWLGLKVCLFSVGLAGLLNALTKSHINLVLFFGGLGGGFACLGLDDLINRTGQLFGN